MANGVKIPYVEYESVTLFSGTNSHVYAQRYGKVVTIQIFNMPPSILQSSTSVSIPSHMRPKSRVDTPMGWIWKSTPGSKPLTGMITDSGVFTGLALFNSTTGVMENVSDSDGNCFATVTYVI